MKTKKWLLLAAVLAAVVMTGCPVQPEQLDPQLATPATSWLGDGVITWLGVSGATEYLIFVDGVHRVTAGAADFLTGVGYFYNLTPLAAGGDGHPVLDDDHDVWVIARGPGHLDSNPSDTLVWEAGMPRLAGVDTNMARTGIVSWYPVLNAVSYAIFVDGTEVATVATGVGYDAAEGVYAFDANNVTGLTPGFRFVTMRAIGDPAVNRPSHEAEAGYLFVETPGAVIHRFGAPAGSPGMGTAPAPALSGTAARFAQVPGLSAHGAPRFDLVTLNGEFLEIRIFGRTADNHALQIHLDDLAAIGLINLPGTYTIRTIGRPGVVGGGPVPFPAIGGFRAMRMHTVGGGGWQWQPDQLWATDEQFINNNVFDHTAETMATSATNLADMYAPAPNQLFGRLRLSSNNAGESVDMIIEDVHVLRGGEDSTDVIWRLSENIMALLVPPAEVTITAPADGYEMEQGEGGVRFTATVAPAGTAQWVSWAVTGAGGGVTVNDGGFISVTPLAGVGPRTVTASIPGLVGDAAVTASQTIYVTPRPGLSAGVPAEGIFMVAVEHSTTVPVGGGHLTPGDIPFSSMISGLPPGITASGTFAINAEGVGSGTMIISGTATEAGLGQGEDGSPIARDHQVTLTLEGHTAYFYLSVVPTRHGTDISGITLGGYAGQGFLGLARTDETVLFREENAAGTEFVALHITGIAELHGLDLIFSPPGTWPNRVGLFQRPLMIPNDIYTLVVEGFADTDENVVFRMHNQTGGLIPQTDTNLTGSNPFSVAATFNAQAPGGPDTRQRLQITDATTTLVLTRVQILNEDEDVVWCMGATLMDPSGGLAQAPTGVNITPTEYSLVAGAAAVVNFAAAVVPAGATPNTAAWSLDPAAVPGASINAASGTLTVTNAIAEGTFYVVASITGTPVTGRVLVTVAGADAPRIDIVGAPLTLAIVAGTGNEVEISAHNIGGAAANANIDFATAVVLNPANAYVTITGTMQMDDGEGSGTITLTVNLDAPSSTHTATITVGAVTETFTLNIVGAGPALIGQPGTVVRTGDNIQEILLGGLPGGMGALIAANHFGAVGATTAFGAARGIVFVENLIGNNTGLRILPAGVPGLQAGDILRATGRTSHTIGSSRLELAGLDAPGSHIGGQENVSPGSPWNVPAGSFTFEWTLDGENINDGLAIVVNTWDGAVVRPEGFGFSIDDLVIFRPVPPAGTHQTVFTMAANLVAEHGIAAGPFTPISPLSVDGAATTVTWVTRNGNLSLQQTGRTANYHGINIAVGSDGLNLQTGDTVTVTGRVYLETGGGGAMELQGQQHSFPGAGEFAFTVTFTIPAAVPASIRVTANRWGAGGVVDGFIIDTIVVQGYR